MTLNYFIPKIYLKLFLCFTFVADWTSMDKQLTLHLFASDLVSSNPRLLDGKQKECAKEKLPPHITQYTLSDNLFV